MVRRGINPDDTCVMTTFLERSNKWMMPSIHLCPASLHGLVNTRCKVLARRIGLCFELISDEVILCL